MYNHIEIHELKEFKQKIYTHDPLFIWPNP